MLSQSTRHLSIPHLSALVNDIPSVPRSVSSPQEIGHWYQSRHTFCVAAILQILIISKLENDSIRLLILINEINAANVNSAMMRV